MMMRTANLQDIYDQLSGGCWVCGAFNTVSDIGLDTAERVFAAVSNDATQLAGCLLGLWCLVFAAKSFLPFGVDNGLWNQGAIRLFGFAVVLGFLAASQAFWDYIFIPMIGSGVGLSVRLLSSILPQSCPAPVIMTGLDGAKLAMHSMNCPLALLQDVFTRGALTGLAMILGAGLQSWLDLLAFWSLPGRFLQLFSGECLSLVYLFDFLMFPVFFVDALFQSLLIAVLAPVAVLCWPFAATRKITRYALRGLGGAALTMVFSSVVAGLAAASVQQVFAQVDIAGLSGAGDWPTLLAQLQAGNAKLSMADQAYWALLGSGVLAIFMVRGARAMAAEFLDASGREFSGGQSAAAATIGGGVLIAAVGVQRVLGAFFPAATGRSAGARRSEGGYRGRFRPRQSLAGKVTASRHDDEDDRR